MSDISQKANKLASAVYLVTSFFSDLEPLKWKLRESSSHLATVSLSFKSYLFNERDYAGLENRQTVKDILTLLAVASNVGLISQANHELLTREFNKYLESIGFPAGIEEREGKAVLSESFFSREDRTLRTVPTPEPQKLKDKNETLPSHPLQREVKPLRQFGAVSVKKNSRQSVIINLLKRKKEIMIKDVSPLISGCSEKTIQRELLAMVAAGILKKIGQKRWSRYTLVQNG